MNPSKRAVLPPKRLFMAVAARSAPTAPPLAMAAWAALTLLLGAVGCGKAATPDQAKAVPASASAASASAASKSAASKSAGDPRGAPFAAPAFTPPGQGKQRPTKPWAERLPVVTVPARGATGPTDLRLTFAVASQANADATTAAVRRAWAWAKHLEPHPIALRVDKDMPGKKHFVEYLALLRTFAAWPGDPAIAAAAVARAREVLKWTDLPGYHDLDTLDDTHFRHDSMSYLRAAILARSFGWDITPYLARIRRVLPRLNDRLASRGVDQQMSFAVLYEELGLTGSPKRSALYLRSRIAKITPFPYWVRRPKQVYEFTHEVFAMTGRGARPFPFTRPIEARYARKVAHTLLHIHMTENNHDAVAELLVNRALLADANDAQVPVARKFLLDGQDAQGRFGVYVPADVRKAFNNPKYDVELGGYIHTAMVALWALMLTS